MTPHTLKELLRNNLIREDQYHRIEPIVSGRVVSLFYELRTLLYLGVLLFTGGVGVFIYDNIGDIGHIVSIILLIVLTLTCFWYVFSRSVPYARQKTDVPSAYYDFIVLLACLLSISVQGYLQYQFEIFDDSLEWNTLLTAALFFFMAYRFDHLGVLSLAIAALASFWSLSISPQKWYSGNFVESANLHITAITFSVIVGSIALILERKEVKKHFTFSYINFCTLIFFGGAIAGLFISMIYPVYLLLIYAGSGYAVYFSMQRRSFMFLLYAFVASYIGTTFLLADLVFDKLPELWFYYSILSCGGFIYFIITYRNYFSRKK
jgi:hypothetical protein